MSRWHGLLCLCVCVVRGRLITSTCYCRPLFFNAMRAWYDSEDDLGGGTRQTVLSFFLLLSSQFVEEIIVSQDSCGRCLFFVSVYTLHSHNRVHTNTHLTPTDGTTLHSHDRVHTNTHLTLMDITCLAKSQYATHKSKKALTKALYLLLWSSMYHRRPLLRVWERAGGKGWIP